MTSIVYNKLKKAGICVGCKKQVDDARYANCSECRKKMSEYRKATRQFDIENGLCTRCHKEYATPGKKMCEVCAVKDNSYPRKAKTEEQLKHDRVNYKKRQEERIKKGLCAKCGKHAISKGSTRLCIDCLIKDRKIHKRMHERNTEIFRWERPTHGLCYRCGNPYEPNGYKLCDDCRKSIGETSKKMDHTKWYESHKKVMSLVFRNG